MAGYVLSFGFRTIADYPGATDLIDTSFVETNVTKYNGTTHIVGLVENYNTSSPFFETCVFSFDGDTTSFVGEYDAFPSGWAQMKQRNMDVHGNLVCFFDNENARFGRNIPFDGTMAATNTSYTKANASMMSGHYYAASPDGTRAHVHMYDWYNFDFYTRLFNVSANGTHSQTYSTTSFTGAAPIRPGGWIAGTSNAFFVAGCNDGGAKTYIYSNAGSRLFFVENGYPTSGNWNESFTWTENGKSYYYSGGGLYEINQTTGEPTHLYNPWEQIEVTFNGSSTDAFGTSYEMEWFSGPTANSNVTGGTFVFMSYHRDPDINGVPQWYEYYKVFRLTDAGVVHLWEYTDCFWSEYAQKTRAELAANGEEFNWWSDSPARLIDNNTIVIGFHNWVAPGTTGEDRYGFAIIREGAKPVPYRWERFETSNTDYEVINWKALVNETPELQGRSLDDMWYSGFSVLGSMYGNYMTIKMEAYPPAGSEETSLYVFKKDQADSLLKYDHTVNISDIDWLQYVGWTPDPTTVRNYTSHIAYSFDHRRICIIVTANPTGMLLSTDRRHVLFVLDWNIDHWEVFNACEPWLLLQDNPASAGLHPRDTIRDSGGFECGILSEDGSIFTGQARTSGSIFQSADLFVLDVNKFPMQLVKFIDGPSGVIGLPSGGIRTSHETPPRIIWGGDFQAQGTDILQRDIGLTQYTNVGNFSPDIFLEGTYTKSQSFTRGGIQFSRDGRYALVAYDRAGTLSSQQNVTVFKLGNNFLFEPLVDAYSVAKPVDTDFDYYSFGDYEGICEFAPDGRTFVVFSTWDTPTQAAHVFYIDDKTDQVSLLYNTDIHPDWLPGAGTDGEGYGYNPVSFDIQGRMYTHNSWAQGGYGETLIISNPDVMTAVQSTLDSSIIQGGFWTTLEGTAATPIVTNTYPDIPSPSSISPRILRNVSDVQYVQELTSDLDNNGGFNIWTHPSGGAVVTAYSTAGYEKPYAVAGAPNTTMFNTNFGNMADNKLTTYPEVVGCNTINGYYSIAFYYYDGDVANHPDATNKYRIAYRSDLGTYDRVFYNVYGTNDNEFDYTQMTVAGYLCSGIQGLGNSTIAGADRYGHVRGNTEYTNWDDDLWVDSSLLGSNVIITRNVSVAMPSDANSIQRAFYCLPFTNAASFISVAIVSKPVANYGDFNSMTMHKIVQGPSYPPDYFPPTSPSTGQQNKGIIIKNTIFMTAGSQTGEWATFSTDAGVTWTMWDDKFSPYKGSYTTLDGDTNPITNGRTGFWAQMYRDGSYNRRLIIMWITESGPEEILTVKDIPVTTLTDLGCIGNYLYMAPRVTADNKLEIVFSARKSNNSCVVFKMTELASSTYPEIDTPEYDQWIDEIGTTSVTTSGPTEVSYVFGKFLLQSQTPTDTNAGGENYYGGAYSAVGGGNYYFAYYDGSIGGNAAYDAGFIEVFSAVDGVYKGLLTRPGGNSAYYSYGVSTRANDNYMVTTTAWSGDERIYVYNHNLQLVHTYSAATESPSGIGNYFGENLFLGKTHMITNDYSGWPDSCVYVYQLPNGAKQTINHPNTVDHPSSSSQTWGYYFAEGGVNDEYWMLLDFYVYPGQTYNTPVVFMINKSDLTLSHTYVFDPAELPAPQSVHFDEWSEQPAMKCDGDTGVISCWRYYNSVTASYEGVTIIFQVSTGTTLRTITKDYLDEKCAALPFTVAAIGACVEIKDGVIIVQVDVINSTLHQYSPTHTVLLFIRQSDYEVVEWLDMSGGEDQYDADAEMNSWEPTTGFVQGWSWDIHFRNRRVFVQDANQAVGYDGTDLQTNIGVGFMYVSKKDYTE